MYGRKACSAAVIGPAKAGLPSPNLVCALAPQAFRERTELSELADTLDSLMELTFQHLAQRCASAGKQRALN